MNMSDFSGKALDGYALSSTDGYNFVTPWIDIHGANHFSVTAVITSGGTISGTFTLQQSNDRQSGNASGVFPASATSPTTNAADTVNTPTGTGAVTLAMSSSATPVTLNQSNVGYRWFRLKYLTATINQSGTVDVFYHWKY
jgi:hypothetical protein